MRMLVSVDGAIGDRWSSKEMEEMITEATPFPESDVHVQSVNTEFFTSSTQSDPSTLI